MFVIYVPRTPLQKSDVVRFNSTNFFYWPPKICSPADPATKIPRRSSYHIRPRVFRKGLNLASGACEKGLPTSSPQLGDHRYPCDRLCALKSCLLARYLAYGGIDRGVGVG